MPEPKTPEELLAMFRAGEIKVLPIVCRRAADPLLPGARTGYRCVLCGLELQVLPQGREIHAAGGTLLCNPCGLALGEEVQKLKPLNIVTTPEVEQQMQMGEASPEFKERLENLRRPLGKTGYPD